MLEQVVLQVPAGKPLLLKLALQPTPDDFDPARDIAAGAAKLEKLGVQKRLKEVQRHMKQLGTGKVPPEIIQEYMQLQNKLKNK